MNSRFLSAIDCLNEPEGIQNLAFSFKHVERRTFETKSIKTNKRIKVDVKNQLPLDMSVGKITFGIQ